MRLDHQTRWHRLKQLVPQPYRSPIRRKVFKLLAPFCRNNLKILATLADTDKWNDHGYVQHYQTHFHNIRKERLNVLEIGIGGYNSPWRGGESLRMWKAYFPNGQIYGLDIEDKSAHAERRIKVFQGSQVDKDLLQRISSAAGGFDIVIDDGSHRNEHVIYTFQTLFPLLRIPGTYVIEDTQTSYWPSYGGGDGSDRTSVGFAKNLIDGVNYREFLEDSYKPSYLDQHIVSLHFYHNLIFIYKDLNDEPSNRDRVLPAADREGGCATSLRAR